MSRPMGGRLIWSGGWAAIAGILIPGPRIGKYGPGITDPWRYFREGGSYQLFF